MKKILLILFLTSYSVFSQELDITSALQNLESGNIQKAESELQNLKMKNPNDPSVIFLDAVITTSGEEAQKKYSIVFEKFPKSKFADAALYRIFSYYFSLGYYKKAETYLTKLKNEYQNSPYINSANRTIPDEEETLVEVKSEKIESKDEIQYNFTIQAGAFLSIENAKTLLDKVNSLDYSSSIFTKEVGSTIFNIITIGKFKTEDDAKNSLDEINKKFNLQGRIIKLN